MLSISNFRYISKNYNTCKQPSSRNLNRAILSPGKFQRLTCMFYYFSLLCRWTLRYRSGFKKTKNKTSRSLLYLEYVQIRLYSKSIKQQNVRLKTSALPRTNSTLRQDTFNWLLSRKSWFQYQDGFAANSSSNLVLITELVLCGIPFELYFLHFNSTCFSILSLFYLISIKPELSPLHKCAYE